MAQEQADREELDKVLHNLDLTWEEKKPRARELDIKKRRRQSVVEDGAKYSKRLRKMKYSNIEQNWGEERNEEQEARIVDAGVGTDTREPGLGSNDGDSRPDKRPRVAPRRLSTSLITKNFTKTMRREGKEEQGWEQKLSFEEGENWSKTWVQNYRGRGGENVPLHNRVPRMNPVVRGEGGGPRNTRLSMLPQLGGEYERGGAPSRAREPVGLWR